MLWRLGALVMALGVILGAFGAHGLESRIDATSLETWRTGVLYHLVHGLGIIVAGTLAGRAARATAVLFLVGVLLFAGSLYTLAVTDWTWPGPVTPFGGVAFIAGWITLAFASVPARADRTEDDRRTA